MEINEKLKHLDKSQINNLIEKYYNNEKITDLIKEFNLKCKSTELVQLFPLKIFEDKLCVYCNTAMVRKYTSRTSIKGEIYCPLCFHKLESTNCSCEECNKIKRDIIIRYYNRKPKIAIEEVSLRNRIYIATILRGMEWVDFNGNIIIHPLNITEKKLAPTLKKEIEILKVLNKDGLLSVEENSKLDAFGGNLLEGTYAESYYVDKVRYILNVEYSSELANPNIDLSNVNIEELYSIYREISLNECYEYLDNQMRKVNFKFNPGITTEEVFDDLLNKFSVGQVYNMIYNSITNATRYYQENKVYKNQAANSVITRCRAYGERIIANNWELKGFNRPYDCEQSIISGLFFNRVFPIGDRGFSFIGKYDNIEKYILEIIKE